MLVAPARATATSLVASLLAATLVACTAARSARPHSDAPDAASMDAAVAVLDDASADAWNAPLLDVLETPSEDADPAPDAAAPPDASAPADASAPECRDDAECGPNRGCRSGLCRNECVLGVWCGTAASGAICAGGLCVECRTDVDCASGRERCDTARSICTERAVDTTRTRFGIFYSTWHCRAARSRPVHDISEVLAGRQAWGDYGDFHYWGRPEAGYYCPSEADAILRHHAELLRDAGIDFVFFDATNHAYVDARSDDTRGMILEPLDRLLAVWSTVPGAPRVVPWVPVVGDHESASTYTVDAILARLGAYPGIQFEYLGRPLLLITENEQYPVDATREAELARSYTVRRMWGVYREDGAPWSFMQRCQEAPTSPEPCMQRVATRDGSIEQITVAAAYQETFMNVSTATPKHQGLTFRRQFERVFDWPETPIVTITGWNEWIAQRQPCGHPACPCSAYPDGCFIDQWDVEYSRDIEPGANVMGDYYYRLMAACISLFRSGARCDAAHAADTCCRAWSP